MYSLRRAPGTAGAGSHPVLRPTRLRENDAVANYCGGIRLGFRATSGPIITKAGDLAAILTNLQPRDVLFIDEIHRLNPVVEEVLYPAMEDFQLDILIGEGPAARSVRIDLPLFTLVGATTRLGLLAMPLRDRFGIQERLNVYSPEVLQAIVLRGAEKLNIEMEKDAALEIASRARGRRALRGVCCAVCAILRVWKMMAR